MTTSSLDKYKTSVPGEVKLWSECFTQHFRDLFLIQKKSLNDKLSAKQFLFQRYYSFDLICSLIGVEPASLSKKILIIYSATRQKKLTISQSCCLIEKIIIESYISRTLFNEIAS